MYLRHLVIESAIMPHGTMPRFSATIRALAFAIMFLSIACGVRAQGGSGPVEPCKDGSAWTGDRYIKAYLTKSHQHPMYGDDQNVAQDRERLRRIRPLFNRPSFYLLPTGSISEELYGVEATRRIVGDESNKFYDADLRIQMADAAQSLQEMAIGILNDNYTFQDQKAYDEIAEKHICHAGVFISLLDTFLKDPNSTNYRGRDKGLHDLHCALAFPPAGFREIHDFADSPACSSVKRQEPANGGEKTIPDTRAEKRVEPPPQKWDDRTWSVAVVIALAILFIGIMILIVSKFPHPTPIQEFVFRLALALIAGGIGAFLPGSISVDATIGIKATGALGLCVLVYVFNPPRIALTHNPRERPSPPPKVD